MPTHYEQLGVAPGASHEDIQREYRRLARDHHPDTLAGASTAASEHAAAIMAAVNAAWTVLGDPARRRAYDEAMGSRAGPRSESDGSPTTGAESGADDEPWWAEPDEPAEPGGLADLVVLIPVGLFALSVVLFAFSLMSQAGSVMALSLVLLPIAGVTFLAMPLVVMMQRARARARR